MAEDTDELYNKDTRVIQAAIVVFLVPAAGGTFNGR